MTHSSRVFLFAALALLALLGARPALADPFSVNADGTVTDNATGLIWDRCSWGQSGEACATGTASAHAWQQALGVAVTANAMNAGAGYKGHTDWRLPNRNELESLVKITASNPAIDTTAFPNTVSDWYWSSTLYTPHPAFAWSVDFDNGYTVANGRNYVVDHVRLVRRGQSLDALMP